MTSPRHLPFLFAASLAAILSPTGDLTAQSSDPTLARPFAIGLNRSQRKPYNFTGRIFDNNTFGGGSGTLIRRHTVLTAAHVIFDVGTGFGTSFTFDRALYTNTRLSISRVIAVAALSGYQDVAVEPDVDVNTASESRDLAYVVLNAPSVDEDFAPYKRQPTPVFKPNNLTDDSGHFALGYPAETFNFSTMAYVVPTAPYVEVAPGYYRNFSYTIESGMSGGPVYSVIDGVQTVVAENTDSGANGSRTFGFSSARAIDKEAEAFLVNAEYSAGLITGTVIVPADPSLVVNPTLNQITVDRGTTITVNTAVVFTVPNASGNTASTTRYKELRLTSDLSGTPPPFTPTGQTPEPLITIIKIAPNQFRVTFGSNNRPNTLVTLQVMNSKTTNAPSAPAPAGSAVSPAPSQLRVLLR